ncbi:MAG TPA: hypothetical protein VFY78_00925, partial [Gammaproteobacteria bacterium]|nr:hypothetical protein [Gammaproteobacteria bacterium]
MANIKTPCLQDCLQRYQTGIPDLASVSTLVPGLTARAATGDLDALIDLYEQLYPLLEKAMWSGDTDFDALLAYYQSLFREQEALIQQTGKDDRYDFILSIPVADRPQHLRACLESILQICQLYGYGGKTSGYYDKIRIVVAEDSRE